MRACTHTHTHTHTHTYTHTHTHTHAHTHTCTHTRTNTHTHTKLHVKSRTHTLTHTHVQTRTHTYTHKITRRITYTHTYTHTHTRTQNSGQDEATGVIADMALPESLPAGWTAKFDESVQQIIYTDHSTGDQRCTHPLLGYYQVIHASTCKLNSALPAACSCAKVDTV